MYPGRVGSGRTHSSPQGHLTPALPNFTVSETEQAPVRLLLASSRSPGQQEMCVTCPRQEESRVNSGDTRENLVPAGLAVTRVPASLLGRSNFLQLSGVRLIIYSQVGCMFLLCSDVGLKWERHLRQEPFHVLFAHMTNRWLAGGLGPEHLGWVDVQRQPGTENPGQGWLEGEKQPGCLSPIHLSL